MGKRSRAARAKQPARELIPAEANETAFSKARLPDISFAEKEALWERAVGALDLGLRLVAYRKDDPRHSLEVETWWRNSVLLRAAGPATATEGSDR
jgi:hypothetical protein